MMCSSMERLTGLTPQPPRHDGQRQTGWPAHKYTRGQGGCKETLAMTQLKQFIRTISLSAIFCSILDQRPPFDLILHHTWICFSPKSP